MIVTLEVPDHLRFQLVYRLERSTPFGSLPNSGPKFEFFAGSPTGLAAFRTLAGVFGLPGAVKATAKLATPRRHLYVLRNESRVVSYGWGTIGKCGYYKIEHDAVVIGPIWTHPESRGQGLATVSLQAAIDRWISHGRRLFYIDTERDNIPAQKVFARCGFGKPIALYMR